MYIKKDILKNMNKNQIQDVLDDMGIDYDKSKTNIKYYLSVIDKELNNKQVNKENHGGHDQRHMRIIENDDEIEITDRKVKLINQNMNFLSKKRDESEKRIIYDNNLKKDNKSENSKINKQNEYNYRNITTPTPHRIEKVNNAFLNVNIPSVNSFTKDKDKSQYSYHSQRKSNISKVGNVGKDENSIKNTVFYNQIMTKSIKVLGGGICIAALCYYIYHIPNLNEKVLYTLNNLQTFTVDNQKEIIKVLLIIFLLAIMYLLYVYYKSKQSYILLCQSIADASVNETTYFLKSQLNNSNVSFIEESKLLSFLSQSHGFDIQIFRKDVYFKYLHSKLELNEYLTKRNLVEDGEIKTFWVYTDEEMEVNSESDI